MGVTGMATAKVQWTPAPAVFVGATYPVATEGPREDRCDAVVFIFFIDG
jgi:hypothetical protein